MNDPSLDLLLARFRDDHDPEALGELFDRTAPTLFPLAMTLTGNPLDAEDSPPSASDEAVAEAGGPAPIRTNRFDRDPAGEAIAAEKASLTRAMDAEIEMRGGAEGGNDHWAYIDGTTCNRVEQLSQGRLDLTAPLEESEAHRAWIRGGLIPHGKVWIVERIDYEVSSRGTAEDSKGMIIRVGDQDLVVTEPSPTVVKGSWTGRIELRRGHVHDSGVAIHDSTWCRVRIHGRLEPAKR